MIPAAKKSLGQNFLSNPAICQRIVDALRVQPEDCVLEIGPGQGALSCLLDTLDKKCFIALEKDKHWAFAMQQKLTSAQLIYTDALAFDWKRLTLANPWKIIGNLPYNIASPLMWDIVEQAQFQQAVFMVQKEVAQRICASPGTKTYGALSVWIQSFAKPEMLFVVPPHFFKPQPKIDSAIIRLLPLNNNKNFIPLRLGKTLRLFFQQRRKQLQKVLKGAGFDAVPLLEKCEIEPSLRPENLTPQQFHKISQMLPF